MTQTGHYLQDAWCRRGQYRTDWTYRILSTGRVVYESSIQDGLQKQAIIYKMGGQERSIQDGLQIQAIIYRMGGVGEVNTGRIIKTGHYLHLGGLRKNQYTTGSSRSLIST